MRNAILVHGKPGRQEYYDPEIPSASNHHWFPWLQKQLLVHDIAAHTPEIPQCYNPQYSIWKAEFERYEITPETVLVGHSCGGGFLLRWLSEHPDTQVGKVVLVAPWIDFNRESFGGFFDFELDANLAHRTKGLMVFSSDDDDTDIQDSVRTILGSIQDAQHRQFHNYGHFTLESMNTDRFPELLEELIRP